MGAAATIAVLGLGSSPTQAAPEFAASEAAVSTCAGQAATITGTTGRDVLTGTAGPDVIAGLAGDDVIRGLDGDDVLCGDDGADLLVGGRGNDALYGGRSGYHSDRGGSYYLPDTLKPGPGDDLVDGGVDPRPGEDEEWGPDTLDYSGSAAAVTVDLLAGTADGQGQDEIVVIDRWRVIGSRYGDIVTGTAFNDMLEGGPGPDTLAGGVGNDELHGDSGLAPDGASDNLSGGDGDDHLFTEGGPDQLSGGPGNDQLFDRDNAADVLHGDDGDDNVVAERGGRDQLYGDAGDDGLFDRLVAGGGQVLDGGPGSNAIAFNTRDDLDVRSEQQRVTGTTDLRDGTTIVNGPEATIVTVQNANWLGVPARWTVWGTDAAETINGAYDGPLTVHAGGGNDHLYGTAYVDLLDGGDGADYARSGKADDTCVSIERTNLPNNTCDETGLVGAAQLASVTSNGLQADRVHTLGYNPAISAGGRYVAFATTASLVPRDTNGVSDVYVRDRKTNRTSLVSVTSRGHQMTKPSFGADISANGQFVAFASSGAAVAGLTPGPSRIFLRDRHTGQTSLVSLNNRGRPANSASYAPSISADGSRIAFLSYATNMGGGGFPNVYVRDRDQRRTTLIDVRTNGTPSPAEATAPTISSNGRFVLFASYDGQLSNSGRTGLFVRDLRTRTTDWVDESEVYYEAASISADGRVVAYTQIDPQCPGRVFDCTVVRVRNLGAGKIRTASVTPEGQRPDGGSAYPVLSGDGRFVLFTSWANNLVPEDVNPSADVFVRDLKTGITTIVSTDRNGGPADGHSGSPDEGLPGVAFADHGGWIVFESAATDLVPTDTNGKADLIVRSWHVLE